MCKGRHKQHFLYVVVFTKATANIANELQQTIIINQRELHTDRNRQYL